MTEPKKLIKLYFFGDSICFGQYISIHKTWTTRIARFVSESYETRSIDVLTQVAAINGETSRGALMRLEHDVLTHAPNIVWVQFGLNDANFWQSERGLPRVTVDAYVANMREICERIQACGTKRILISTNHRVTKTPAHLDENVYSRNCELYNRELRKLAERFDRSAVTLIDLERDLEQRVESPNQYLMEDGVHLNEFGHEIYWTLISRAILEAVEDVLSTGGEVA